MSEDFNPHKFIPLDHPLLTADYFGKPRRQINVTTALPRQTEYTLAINNEFKAIAFDELRAPFQKGNWNKNVFKTDPSKPLDLEVGTGNGTHFAWYALKNPGRNLVGIELKYKPLIQSIRRATFSGCKNAAICRFHAFNLDLLFEKNELDNVIIHFPDPWVTPLKPKNRFVSKENLEILFGLQKPGSMIEFKTDSRDYFDWSLEEIKQTPYQVLGQSFDLHRSEFAEGNFQTQFEKIFMAKQIPINYIRLQKPKN